MSAGTLAAPGGNTPQKYVRAYDVAHDNTALLHPGPDGEYLLRLLHGDRRDIGAFGEDNPHVQLAVVRALIHTLDKALGHVKRGTVVTTAAELDALPTGSIVQSTSAGLERQRVLVKHYREDYDDDGEPVDSHEWVSCGHEVPWDGDELERALPLEVLWTPEAGR